jgi:mannose-6-phosphate isomerase-like protein (cupin superfamily)
VQQKRRTLLLFGTLAADCLPGLQFLLLTLYSLRLRGVMPHAFLARFCASLICGVVLSPFSIQSQSHMPTPLILEKDEGERRVWRPLEGVQGLPSLFILKVDPQNGRSSHLVFGAEDLPAGGRIDAHRHHGSDEILFLQNGLARVSVGNTVREVHAGATVFIPADVWISAVNLGNEPIHLIYIFSAPGFEEFMRAESVREGEKLVPLTKAEDAAILAKHAHAVVYKEQ